VTVRSSSCATRHNACSCKQQRHEERMNCSRKENTNEQNVSMSGLKFKAYVHDSGCEFVTQRRVSTNTNVLASVAYCCSALAIKTNDQ